MSAAIENPSPHGADAATPGRECARILLVDAERDALDVLALALGGAGHEVVRATAAVEAARELEHGRLDLVITATEPDGPGPAVLRIARERWPALPVIATSRDASVAAAVSAMKLGACDFVPHPVDQAQLAQAVRRIVEQNALLRAGRAARRPGEGRPDAELIVGRTHQMQKVFELVEAVADSKATVLIRGETGTGKSLVARAIHQRSQRRHRPFVEISCGAIPETLLESELFGHVKGAFTGAMADKEGKFRAAEGGTVFLDEVSCASASLQVKLLRVLQERKFEPLGSNKTLTADVRVVLATNLDLHKEVEARRFREDL
ncbi:MAG: sigma 54-interacting transcriptional regulator, partial [Planctomycetota bacterium]